VALTQKKKNYSSTAEKYFFYLVNNKARGSVIKHSVSGIVVAVMIVI
jgi:hypothetical protein